MPDLTDALRRSLTDHAIDAPGVAGLDARVYARSRRLAWRQRGLVAAAAALVLAVAVPAIILVLPDPRTDRHLPATALEKYGPTVFPARVTYVPPMFAGVTPTVVVEPARLDLQYRRTSGPLGDTDLMVSARAPDPVTLGGATLVRETTVNGVKATLLTWGPDALVLAWQRTPGSWTMVWVSGIRAAPVPIDEAFLRPVAEGITDGTTDAVVAIAFDLVPRGYVLGFMVFPAARLCPVACVNEVNRNTDIRIEVVTNRHGVEPLPGDDVAVGPHTGRLVRHAFGRDLEVFLSNGSSFMVAIPEGNPLSDKDLIAFAAGVTVILP